MPKVRASSGTIGTMYLPSSGSFSSSEQDAHEGHGGGHFAAARAVQRFGEEFERRAPEW